MATRRPLVLVSGQTSELPAGDMLFAGSSSTSVSFASGDSFQRVTLADATVTATNRPYAFSVCTNAASEGADLNLAYQCVLESYATGSFVLQVQAFDPEGDTLDGIPLPDVTVFYSLGN